MTRTDGARRLLYGLIVIPYSVLLLAVLLVVGVPLWLLNNLWAVLTGTPLLRGNNRLGFAMYVAQNNIQAVLSGRGDVQWVPF